MTKIPSRKNTDFVIKKLLVKLGNKNPNYKQLKLAESLLLKTNITKELTFNPKLTSRELCCLLLASLGKRVKETANLLEVMPSTVETWHKNIKYKLESETMAQAVYKGISHGYLREYSGQDFL
jgi:DNA-binding NarL/FixJ family response regulator